MGDEVKIKEKSLPRLGGGLGDEVKIKEKDPLAMVSGD
jgi:hypothetical protein